MAKDTDAAWDSRALRYGRSEKEDRDREYQRARMRALQARYQYQENHKQDVLTRRGHDPVTGRDVCDIRVFGVDGIYIVLYHGPFPPTQADILDHWSKMLADAIVGDGT